MAVSKYRYDDTFMRLANQARTSAEVIVRLMQEVVPIASVADFGCALGTWLSVWQSAGVTDIVGVDGDYIRTENLLIPPQCFQPRDLSNPIHLGRRFDLVESMEVAEHLPENAAEGFVASLVRHADIVLFSAAPPGQGGEHHVNERPYEYWRELFVRQGYRMFDWIRPQIRHSAAVQFWYRYNLFLFVADAKVPLLPDIVKRSEIRFERPVPDISPWSFRMRKQIVRHIPQRIQNKLSQMMSRRASSERAHLNK